MEIKNIDGLSTSQIRQLVSQGGKFVHYKYCISIVVMTFNRPTDIYFIPPGESSVTKGLGFLFTSLLLGWWGIPWGPIYTIGNIYNVLSGGTDVTEGVMTNINNNDSNYGSGNNYNVSNSNNSNSAPSYNIPTGSNQNGSNSQKPNYNIQ